MVMVLQFPWFSSYDLLLQFFLLFPFSFVRSAFLIQHSLLQHTQAFQARSNHCEDVFWAQNTFILISSDWFRQFKITMDELSKLVFFDLRFGIFSWISFLLQSTLIDIWLFCLTSDKSTQWINQSFPRLFIVRCVRITLRLCKIFKIGEMHTF